MARRTAPAAPPPAPEPVEVVPQKPMTPKEMSDCLQHNIGLGLIREAPYSESDEDDE